MRTAKASPMIRHDLRIPLDLSDRLRQSAWLHKRSLNAEIVAALHFYLDPLTGLPEETEVEGGTLRPLTYEDFAPAPQPEKVDDLITKINTMGGKGK